MKWIRRAVYAVVLLVLIIGAVLYFRIDSIIKSTVQTQATDSLNLKTTLGSADLSLFGGKLGLKQLDIASPKGFAAPHMLELGSTNVAVNYSQLRKEPIHVASLTLDKPKLVIEQSNGVFNFKKAMDLMPKSQSSSGSEPMKLIIDSLKVQDAQVLVRPGVPGLPAEMTIPVPSLTLKDIGRGEGAQNGAAIKDVAMQVITALAGSASSSNGMPSQLKQMLNANLGQVIGQLGAQAQQRVAAAIPGQLGQALSQAVKDPQALLKDPGKALSGLGGMLGSPKSGSTATSQPADLKNQAIDAFQGLLGGGKKKN